ncbi:MAG: LamG-like jellyroll fold domain-containing protein, partial [Planctomycetota bacterium]
MSKKLLFSVFVLGFILAGAAGAADPDLFGWWRLDDGSGTTARDSSGNGNHGTLTGDPEWVAGKIGGALQFDGQGAERVLLGSFDVTGNAISIACWFKADNLDTPGNDPRMVSKAIGGSNDQHWFMVSSSRQSGIKVLRFRLRTDGVTSEIKADTTTGTIELDTWIHVTTTWDGATMRIYKNGVEVGSLAKGGTLSAGPAVNVAIGNQPTVGDDRPFSGLIDDVRIYTRALTPEEIAEVMKGTSPTLASNPSPAYGATDVSRDVVLSWTPGEFAPAVNGHTVYLSESFTDVNDGVGGITLSASSYAPERLDFETIYYWRVDEVNAPPDSTVFEGDVWSFTTEPVGYAIDGANITATASSTGQADFGPEKTIDGSGLDENSLHSTEPMDMWLSGSEPLGAWIQYELDKMYKLHEMWVWNSNQIFESLFGFGMRAVTVEYSTNGTDWTAQADVPEFAQAPGTGDYAHDTTVDFGGAVAKVVRLTATSNWAGVLPQYGLSEVRFFSMPVSAREPSPDSGATDVDVDVVLGWRAGREAATHDVYLSTDEQAVIDGTVPAAT